MKTLYKFLVLLLLGYRQLAFAQNGIVVFQSDFGLKDGAVSAMKGVAMGVSPNLKLFDLTHEIPAYDIWEAAYRLYQTVPYYPAGTVFVSVCDPGVGTDRHSVVLLTKTGHYIVTPDNGTLTLIADKLGIQEVREIDEAVNRLTNSNESYTFHGRDVYAYTAARLASRTITFQQVGNTVRRTVVSLPYQKADYANGVLQGNIPILDVQYGNVWTNIPKAMLEKLGVKSGDSVRVKILHQNKTIYDKAVRMVNTFGEAAVGDDVAYINSLLNFSVAVNQGNFSDKYKVFSGADWTIVLSKQ
ncbi:S-adenosyl-l-methionine hydroxide adenosyltransferase family protein [Spirosoma sp. RP8]|uniref:S-adenosyl-l-methionine hydroxide adenosyltransferase family protein n=1 Tax=Spirosoma liriopis TaxID=2937440 RepID=A0ABT0HH79_9BACT|nr:S-adenosyl-l-methionine hydroxide adenosyltransferase family protein [Spirosoma liriopis]MCK8491522.1 S-adenosyl-l-methionine hydroxide adenosyltransferase family protein [Spirosoma liriopis]